MKYHLLPIEDYRRLKKTLRERILSSPSMFGFETEPTEEQISRKITELSGFAGELNDIAIRSSNIDKNEYLDKMRHEMNLSEFNKFKQKFHKMPPVFYLYDAKSMKDLVDRLKPGDTICLHGEGQPFVIGLNGPSCYDLDPKRLADLLHEADLPDGVNIDLIACNSAVNFTDDGYVFNFAKDTSEALHYLHHRQNINVSGYKGLVVDKENGKFSVSKTIASTTRGDHMSLDTGRLTYNNGVKTEPDRAEISSVMTYGWAEGYINTAKHSKDIINERIIAESQESPSSKPISTNSFFSETYKTTDDIDNSSEASIESKTTPTKK